MQLISRVPRLVEEHTQPIHMGPTPLYMHPVLTIGRLHMHHVSRNGDIIHPQL